MVDQEGSEEGQDFQAPDEFKIPPLPGQEAPSIPPESATNRLDLPSSADLPPLPPLPKQGEVDVIVDRAQAVGASQVELPTIPEAPEASAVLGKLHEAATDLVGLVRKKAPESLFSTAKYVAERAGSALAQEKTVLESATPESVDQQRKAADLAADLAHRVANYDITNDRDQSFQVDETSLNGALAFVREVSGEGNGPVTLPLGELEEGAKMHVNLVPEFSLSIQARKGGSENGHQATYFATVDHWSAKSEPDIGSIEVPLPQ